MNPARGFTLLEVLIAVAVLGLIGGLTWKTFDGAYAIKARIDWEPPQPYHVFAIDIEAAGWVTFAQPRIGIAWDTERGLRRWKQREA